jgi:hypothetical protein
MISVMPEYRNGHVLKSSQESKPTFTARPGRATPTTSSLPAGYEWADGASESLLVFHTRSKDTVMNRLHYTVRMFMIVDIGSAL